MMWPLSKCRFLVSIWLTSYKQQGAQVKLKKRKIRNKRKKTTKGKIGGAQESLIWLSTSV